MAVSTDPWLACVAFAFLAGTAATIVLPGVSTNPDIDIVQLQDIQKVRENSVSARLDFKLSPNWNFYARVFRFETAQRGLLCGRLAVQLLDAQA